MNIDGGLYGPHLEAPITVPYLMLYSELNTGGNDLAQEAAEAGFREMTVPGAKHLDFHDAALVLPILRWAGQLGKVSGAEVTAEEPSDPAVPRSDSPARSEADHLTAPFLRVRPRRGRTSGRPLRGPLVFHVPGSTPSAKRCSSAM